MARYIDADSVHKFVEQKVAEGKDGWSNGVPYEWEYALAVIDMQPTADVAPKSEVVREIFKDIFAVFRGYEFDALVSNRSCCVFRFRNFMVDILKIKDKHTEGKT
jgi:hypothetical protein